MPNTIATRSPRFSRFMQSFSRLAVRLIGVVLTAGLIVSCTETTAPARRFPVLDDVGHGDWASVSVGGDHTCALKTNGAAYCWGSDQYGQLGIARADTVCGAANATYPCELQPKPVQGGLTFTSISAGARHTCALTRDGAAYCWGANDANQIADVGRGGPTPTRLAGTLPWTQISAGDTHSCGVRSDGSLYCWGTNDRGQLGIGGTAGVVGQARARITVPVATVSAGEARTCARSTAGTLYCWGAVWTSRQGGLEFTRAQLTPQLVPGAPAVASVSVGTFTTCATDLSGAAYCWEANPRGEMGNGSTDGSTSPLPVSSALPFVQVSAGIAQTCGILVTGNGYCWGDDSFGQLGVSPSTLSDRCSAQSLPCATRPVAVVGRQLFVQISTGFGSHACGVTTLGNLYCWGLGASGQRGDGTMISGVSTPLEVAQPK